MNSKLYILRIFLSFLAISLLVPVAAQVTIGSGKPAITGALLDLKEYSPTPNNETANRGLGLPRVKLSDMNNLYPMFESTSTPGTPTSEYGSSKSDIDIRHAGLVVYNINQCDGFGSGTYVWMGDIWEPLSTPYMILEPNISIVDADTTQIDHNTLLLRLPSGKDIRPFPADKKFSLKLDWRYPADGYLQRTNIEQLGAQDGADGGLKFINSTDPSTWINPVYTSPVTFDYEINDMSDIITDNNPYISNPFRSRETILTYYLAPNECFPTGRQMKIRLNQTNYRLTLKKGNEWFNNNSYQFLTGGRFGTGTHYYRMLVPYVKESLSYGDAIAPEIQSNAEWKVTLTKTKYFSNVFSNINLPATGGQEIFDGTTPGTLYDKPIRVSNASDYDTRGELAASLKFEDRADVPRFYPVILDFVQCSSDKYDDDPSQVTNVGNTPSPWNTNGVLKHTDQSGNIFYSAVFNNKRWMITNLGATQYDTQSPVNGIKSLLPYDNTSMDDHAGGQGKFAYPQTESATISNSNWGVEPTDWRPTEGVFYNWYAATGRGFQDNGNVEEGNTNQTSIQGICPNGWHLPSDKEWSELEKFIYDNIRTNSTYEQSLLDEYVPQMPAWQPSWNTDPGERGPWLLDGAFGHGGAMKEMCGIKGQEFFWLIGTHNYSPLPRFGGFNAMLAGRIGGKVGSGSTPNAMQQQDRYANGDYWSASQGSSPNAIDNSNTGWIRGFTIYGSTVLRAKTGKTLLSSVRCVKNPDVN